jgi:hypothetical protein
MVHDAGLARTTRSGEENVAGADIFPELGEEFVPIAEIGGVYGGSSVEFREVFGFIAHQIR